QTAPGNDRGLGSSISQMGTTDLTRDSRSAKAVRRVIPGSRLLATDRLANRQSGSPPGTLGKLNPG
ncbi:MAG: hypothetical protein WAM44_00250, partial [Chthoniobacterales bacterium]